MVADPFMLHRSISSGLMRKGCCDHLNAEALLRRFFGKLSAYLPNGLINSKELACRRASSRSARRMLLSLTRPAVLRAALSAVCRTASASADYRNSHGNETASAQVLMAVRATR